MFKIGDFVKHGKDLHRVLEVDINKNGEYVCIVDIPMFFDTWLLQNKFKLWQPQPGEYIFDEQYGLAKVVSNTTDEGIEARCCFGDKFLFTPNYKEIQPFIGKLPTFLKNNK